MTQNLQVLVGLFSTSRNNNAEVWRKACVNYWISTYTNKSLLLFFPLSPTAATQTQNWYKQRKNKNKIVIIKTTHPPPVTEVNGVRRTGKKCETSLCISEPFHSNKLLSCIVYIRMWKTGVRISCSSWLVCTVNRSQLQPSPRKFDCYCGFLEVALKRVSLLGPHSAFQLSVLKMKAV